MNLKQKYISFFEANKVDLVYRTSLLEGEIATRFQTQQIIKSREIKHLTKREYNTISNIYNTWKKIVSHPYEQPTIDFYSYLNELVTQSTLVNFLEEGQFRVKRVTISQSTYIPKVRTYQQTVEEVNGLFNTIKPTVDSILKLYLTLMKEQYFNDGNKRTAYFLANYLLMNYNLGVLTLPETVNSEWYSYLKEYYEKDLDKPFIQYLREEHFLKI